MKNQRVTLTEIQAWTLLSCFNDGKKSDRIY